MGYPYPQPHIMIILGSNFQYRMKEIRQKKVTSQMLFHPTRFEAGEHSEMDCIRHSHPKVHMWSKEK